MNPTTQGRMYLHSREVISTSHTTKHHQYHQHHHRIKGNKCVQVFSIELIEFDKIVTTQLWTSWQLCLISITIQAHKWPKKCKTARKREYGGLHENGLRRPIGSGTIRRCGILRVGVALLKEVRHWGQSLRFHILKPGPVALSIPATCRSGCITLNCFSNIMCACTPPCYPLWW